MERTITITQALNELKLLDSKINKAISSNNYVGVAKKCSNMVGAITKTEFGSRVQSKYQSVLDLIAERAKIKAAIVISNASTKVKIADVTMTVAEAIERKTSIEYEKDLLVTLKSQYADCSNSVNRQNREVDNQITKMIQGMTSGEKETTSDPAAVEKFYRENNECELVDPIKIFDEFTALEEKIDNFESEVDTILVVSNSSTFITI